jgi:hypothetical protein
VIPEGFPPDRCVVPTPWAIIEQPIPADTHLREPHVHIDYQYLAVVSEKVAAAAINPANFHFGWFTEEDLDRLFVREEVREVGPWPDTKLIAKAMFAYLETRVPS